MDLTTEIQAFLETIELLPRRFLLETPGLMASVPMLRGVWGAALHGLDLEAYGSVFASGTGSEGSGIPGYVLRPAPPDPELSPAVDFLLIGEAVKHNDALLRAWDIASGMGLGPNRERFFVHQTFALRADGGLDRPTREPASWRLAEAAWPLPGMPSSTPCRIRFEAPLRLLRQGNLLERPTLTDLAVAACRRVVAFLSNEKKGDFDGLRQTAIETARGVSCGSWQGERYDLVRYSGRQGKELTLRGVSGWLDLPEGPGPIWPLFAAAQWLHLGKGTIVGLGQPKIEPLAE